MKILIVDAPGVHPAGGPRALASAFHAAGYSVMVHPMRTWSAPWYRRGAAAALAQKVLAAHEPDVVHVIGTDPALAEAFGGQGVPVVHSTLDRSSRSDWVIAPTPAALGRLHGAGPRTEGRCACLPYTLQIAPADTPAPSEGGFVRVFVAEGDREARGWFDAVRRALPEIPMRETGEAVESRLVLSLSSAGELWPRGIAEGTAAGRAVVTPWIGLAEELVLEGVSGFLSAPGDVASLVSHVRYLWNEAGEADRMGREAREEARAIFGAEAHLKRLLPWYFRAGTSRLAV